MPRQNRGMALVTVLWVLSILTMWASVIAGRSMSERRSVARLIEATNTSLAADSAIRLELLRIGASRGHQVASGSEWQTVRLHEATVKVSVALENGRVDINHAPAELIAAVIEAGGVKSEAARALADEITAWRSADGTAGAGPSTRDDVALTEYSPRKGPFESVGEVRQVPGGASLSEEILDGFTVYSHSAEPEANAGPPLVQRATELWRGKSNLSLATASFNPQPTNRRLAGEVIHLRACVQLRDSTFCRVAIARVTGAASPLAQMFAWYTQWE
jgi:type II secretory pathway component PulK